MKVNQIRESKFHQLEEKQKKLLKDRSFLEHKSFQLDRKIDSLKHRRKREIEAHKKTLEKRQKKINDKFSEINKRDLDNKAFDTYHKIRFKLDPKRSKIISGEEFEKELSKHKGVKKTLVRAYMVQRNNHLRESELRERAIYKKYYPSISRLSDKKDIFEKKTREIGKKRSPYVSAVQVASRNKQKIENLKNKLKEVSKKYQELEKDKPEWKGMQYSDEYYFKKDKNKDRFISLDIQKDKIEKEINKLAKETNKKLYEVK